MKSVFDMQQAITRSPGKPRALNSLRTRRHGLNPPRSLLSRAGLALQSAIEAGIISSSVLADVPVYPLSQFPWTSELESQWRVIRNELDPLMARRDRMPSFHEIIEEVGTITQDDGWKTFFLISAGRPCAQNARQCPETMRLLGAIPEVATAFFSILSPAKHIPAHRGAYNGVLRYHLGLQVPEPPERCRIRIADEVHHWQEGKSLIFDDTYNHEVWNDTDGYRVVLFVDFARPLKGPWRRFNRWLLKLAPLAPFLRQADARQKKWEQTFYPK